MGIEERLAEVETRFNEVEAEMASPEAASDPDRLRELGRSYAELREIVEPYRAYRQALTDAQEAREVADAESDADMAAYAREEAETAEAKVTELRAQLELALVP